MRKTIVCAIVAIVLLIVAQAIRGRTVYQDQSEYKAKIGYDHSRENDSTTIEYMVKKAKDKGLNQVVRGNRMREPVRVKGVDEAIDRFSTIVVTPMEKTTQIQFLGAGLETLYRCKISEKVHLNKKASGCCGSNDLRKFVRNIPDESEIPGDEIYLRTAGGSILVDGVEVAQEEYPARLELGRTYLVFLSHDDSAKVGRIAAEGVFELEADGRMKHKAVASKYSNLLLDDIKNGLGDSMLRLKDRVKLRQATAK